MRKALQLAGEVAGAVTPSTKPIAGYLCPACGYRTCILDSRPCFAQGEWGIRRRRGCPSCGKRLSTYEFAGIVNPTRKRLHAGVAALQRSIAYLGIHAEKAVASPDGKWPAIFSQMDIGDSFLIPPDLSDGVRSAANAYGIVEGNGAKFSIASKGASNLASDNFH
jgi:hypothetical protein